MNVLKTLLGNGLTGQPLSSTQTKRTTVRKGMLAQTPVCLLTCLALILSLATIASADACTSYAISSGSFPSTLTYYIGTGVYSISLPTFASSPSGCNVESEVLTVNAPALIADYSAYLTLDSTNRLVKISTSDTSKNTNIVVITIRSTL